MSSKQKTLLLDVGGAKVSMKRNLILSFVIERSLGSTAAGGKEHTRKKKQHHTSLQFLKDKKYTIFSGTVYWAKESESSSIILIALTCTFFRISRGLWWIFYIHSIFLYGPNVPPSAINKLNTATLSFLLYKLSPHLFQGWMIKWSRDSI